MKGARILCIRLSACWPTETRSRTCWRSTHRLTREDIMACLDYAAELAEEHVTPLQAVDL